MCSGNGTEGSCSTDSSLSAKPGQGLVSYGEDVVVQSRTVANVVDQEIQLLQSSNTVFLKAEQDSQSSKSEKDKVIPGEPTDYFLEEVGNDTNQLIHNLESLPPRAQVWTKSSENCATIPKIINDYKGKSLYDSDVALNTSDYVETENVIEDSVKNIFAPEGKDADRLQENLLVQTLNDEPVEQLNQQEDSTVYLVETVKPCAALYTDVGSDIAHKAVKSADFQLVELEPLSIPTGVLSSVESKHMLPSCEKQSQNNVSKADQIPVISESPKEPSLLEVEIRQDHVGSIPIVLSGEEVIADQTCSLSPNVHPVEPNDRNKSLISDGPLMDATREHKESEIAYRSKKESYDKFVLPMNLGLAVASTAEFQGSDYVPADASPRNPGYESKVKIEQDAVEIEIDLDKERDEQMQSSVADGQAIQENFEVLSKSVSAVERISFHDSTPSDGGHELGLGLGLGNEQSTLAFEESKFQIASDGRNFVSQPLISSPTAEGFSKHLANYKFPSIKQGLVEDLHADKETNIKSSLTNTNQINAEKLVQISQAVQMPTKQYLYDSKLSDKLRGIRMIIDYQFYLESVITSLLIIIISTCAFIRIRLSAKLYTIVYWMTVL